MRRPSVRDGPLSVREATPRAPFGPTASRRLPLRYAEIPNTSSALECSRVGRLAYIQNSKTFAACFLAVMLSM
jgi:hypothetical protein